jgi:DNA-binding response OmpR family regulator
MMRESTATPRASRIVIGCACEAESAVLTHWSLSAGFECCRCRTADDWLRAVRRQGVVLAIIDATFADGIGLDLAREARQRGCSASILFIADEERSSSFDTVVDTGVSDFIRRPVDVDELLARVRVATRHKSGVYLHALQCGPIRIELGRNLAYAHGNRLDLPPAQYRVLVALIERYGAVVDREEIQKEVLSTTGDGQAVSVHVHHLRRELEKHGCYDYIETVRGRGYRFRLPGDVELAPTPEG